MTHGIRQIEFNRVGMRIPTISILRFQTRRIQPGWFHGNQTILNFSTVFQDIFISFTTLVESGNVYLTCVAEQNDRNMRSLRPVITDTSFLTIRIWISAIFESLLIGIEQGSNIITGTKILSSLGFILADLSIIGTVITEIV